MCGELLIHGLKAYSMEFHGAMEKTESGTGSECG